MSENHVYIIIPVYNREKLITVCVESVLRQTISSWTAIIVDDGSTDGTAAILDGLAEKDNRLNVIHQENTGIAGARNRGLDEVFSRLNRDRDKIHDESDGICEKRDYIMFLDSDDILEPIAMEHAVNTAVTNDADIVQWQADDFISDDENPEDISKKRGSTENRSKEKAQIVTDSKGALEILLDTKGKGADKRFHFLWNDCRCVWTKLCRTTLYEGVRCPLGKSYEDDFIVDDLFMKAERIVFINESLTNYRFHGGNFLKTTRLKDMLDHTECERNRFVHATRYNDSELIKIAFHNVLMSSANSYKLSCKEKCPNKKLWKELAEISNGYEKSFDVVDRVIFRGFRIAPGFMNLVYEQYRKMKE